MCVQYYGSSPYLHYSFQHPASHLHLTQPPNKNADPENIARHKKRKGKEKSMDPKNITTMQPRHRNRDQQDKRDQEGRQVRNTVRQLFTILHFIPLVTTIEGSRKSGQSFPFEIIKLFTHILMSRPKTLIPRHVFTLDSYNSMRAASCRSSL